VTAPPNPLKDLLRQFKTKRAEGDGRGTVPLGERTIRTKDAFSGVSAPLWDFPDADSPAEAAGQGRITSPSVVQRLSHQNPGATSRTASTGGGSTLRTHRLELSDSYKVRNPDMSAHADMSGHRELRLC
jgi:hypothetical protein